MTWCSVSAWWGASCANPLLSFRVQIGGGARSLQSQKWWLRGSVNLVRQLDAMRAQCRYRVSLILGDGIAARLWAQWLRLLEHHLFWYYCKTFHSVRIFI